MKRACVLFALVASVAFAAEVLTVDKLIEKADTHNNNDVVVTGKVSDFQAKTSKAGNPYTNFKLKGENTVASVYFQGHMESAPRNGDTVEVTGVYRKEKKVNDSFTVKNEIDATKKQGKKYGVKVTKKADR